MDCYLGEIGEEAKKQINEALLWTGGSVCFAGVCYEPFYLCPMCYIKTLLSVWGCGILYILNVTLLPIIGCLILGIFAIAMFLICGILVVLGNVFIICFTVVV